MRTLYSLLWVLGLPFILARLWWRGRTLPAYRQRLAERFGQYRPAPYVQDKPLVWLHAVSVGEVIAAAGIIDFLLQQPQWQLLVTTTTPTGSAQLLKKYAKRVLHVYAPYDIPLFYKGFFRLFKPRLHLLMETELWPNSLAACQKAKVPVWLLNARLSAKSARRYQRLPAFSRSLMNQLSGVVAQYAADGDRFMALGLPAHKLHLSGNIKLDETLSPAVIASAAELKHQLGARPVVIAGSTHEGEDQPVLDAFRTLRQQAPNALLILAPRHPDRFNAVAQLCQQQGLRVIRRSACLASGAPAPTFDQADILLGDTLGELLMLYGAAQAAFVGGSWVPKGGHNLLEAALWGIPLATGPSVFNFLAIAQGLQQSGGLITVANAQALGEHWLLCLQQPQKAQQQGQQALAFVAHNRGALQRLLQVLAGVLS